MIIQIMPAPKWRLFRESSITEPADVAAFGLTDDGRVVPLVVSEDKKSVAEIKDGEYLIVGPLRYAQMKRAAALKKYGITP